MNRTAWFAAGLAASLTLFGCFDAPDTHSATDPSIDEASTVAPLAYTERVAGPGDAPGFVHRAAASKFRFGATRRELSEAAWGKVVGSEGVFATDAFTGAVRANPNGDAPSVQAAALSTDPEVHNKRVLSYFRAAGLPVDQVGGAHVTTIMKVEGAADELIKSQRPKFVAYTTIVERVIDGIRVPDSFAWARFNERDEVVAEGVYWPMIPASAIASARALRDHLADTAGGEAFRTSLGVNDASAKGGLVTIRHSAATSRAAFEAFASYDVHVPYGGQNGRGHTVHFDASGKPRTLAEAAPDATPARDTPK